MAVNALAQLIEDVQEASSPRLSLAEIARRSGVSPQRVHQLVRDEMKAMPDPETLRRLAAGLSVPLRLVVDAALASLGLPHADAATGGGTVAEMRRIVEASTVMSSEDREYWKAMIDALEQRVASKERGRRGA